MNELAKRHKGGGLEPTTYVNGIVIGDETIRTIRKGKDHGFVKWFDRIETETITIDNSLVKRHKGNSYVKGLREIMKKFVINSNEERNQKGR